MAFYSHQSLFQNSCFSFASSSTLSSSDSHLLLLSDFVNCRVFRPINISFRRNIYNTIFPLNANFSCSATSGENLADSAKEKAGDGQSVAQGEWDQLPSGVSSGTLARNSTELISLGIKEPVYEVIEVKSDGKMSMKKISRRQLLKSSGLRPRDIRSVDPSLWLTNSMPSLLVREQAILLNFGSLRAIAMQECVLIFDYNRKGGKAFLESLLPRLNPRNVNGGPCMPFELEVVEAALLSRIQRLEQKLMDVEPQVVALLEVLPNRLTADVLEQLRLSKQTLVELGSRAGALKQMLLDLLEDPHEIRRICVMGRNCTVRKGNNDMECSVPLEKQIAEGSPHLCRGFKAHQVQKNQLQDILICMEYYLQKTYYKTASLISYSCKAVALLSGQTAEVSMLAYDYGKNLGMAFQLIDDVLDFTGTSASLGKGSLSDIRHGIITAPILFAMEEFPQLRGLIDRGFDDPSNVDLALDYLGKSRGIQRTRELAAEHANLAVAAIDSLPESDDEDVQISRRALVDITHRVITRTK